MHDGLYGVHSENIKRDSGGSDNLMAEIGFLGWILSIVIIILSMILDKWFHCFNDVVVSAFVVLMWGFWVVMVIGMLLPLLT